MAFHGHVDYDYGVEAGEMIAKIKSETTATFVTADVVAAGVITGLHNKNVSVPKEISIIGFDNIPMAKMIVPSLTTINQNIYEKGIRSMEQLISVIETNEKGSKDRILMPLEVIERKSVKKLNS